MGMNKFMRVILSGGQVMLYPGAIMKFHDQDRQCIVILRYRSGSARLTRTFADERHESHGE